MEKFDGMGIAFPWSGGQSIPLGTKAVISLWMGQGHLKCGLPNVDCGLKTVKFRNPQSEFRN
jgi:hypothetical protein